MQFRPGEKVGPYEIVAPIGAGGMGEVYRARDERLERDVALKILPRGTSDEAGAARFRGEAKSIAALSHPNIVAVFDFGTHADVMYIAMELVDGASLRDSSTGRTPWKQVVAIGSAIAEALASAHDKGIVHRDLKPENVVITRSGAVKVLDFGLARSVVSSPDQPTITQTGNVVGTAGYMAPEQVRGESISFSSDVFALGCMLYELLAGRHPFRRNSNAETMAAVLRDEPPDLRKLAPDAPEMLVSVIERCIEKDATRRFRTAADVAFALRSSSSSEVEVRVPPPRRNLKLALLVIAIAALIIFGRRMADAPPAPKPVKSVAVLPFSNDTNDVALGYLSDGLTEAVINNLAPVAGFKVLSRNSVFSYKPATMEPQAIGTDLGVDAVVTGRLTSREKSLVMSVNLIDTRDGHQIWGERYERPLADIATLERELSREISQRLQLRLTQADQVRINRAADVRPEAYRLYLQGRYELNKRSAEGLKKGIEFFRRSIEIDPAYAPAHAGVADSFLLLGGVYEVMRPLEAMPMARKSAMQAIELDPHLADPHASLGMIAHEFEWDWPRAEQSFKRAIELNDSCVSAHQWYGQALVYRGRFDEGLRQLLRAEELDPLSLVTKSDVAQAYWIARKYDLAIARAASLIEIEPNFWLGHLFLGFAHIGRNDFQRAIPALERAVSLGGSAAALGSLGYAYARSGRRADADRLLHQLRQRAASEYVSPTAFFMIHLGLRDLDRAFAEIDRGISERASLVTVLDTVPIAEELRRDPRYAAVARRVGF